MFLCIDLPLENLTLNEENQNELNKLRMKSHFDGDMVIKLL